MFKSIVTFTALLFLHLFPTVIFSQSVEIQLPYYAGRDYYFYLLEGSRQDTIATGELDARGRAKIGLPKDYRGTGRFSVKEYGRIWSIVIRSIVINGNENILMSEPEVLEANPTFDNSPENNFLHSSFTKQNNIINDYYQVANEPKRESLILALPEQRLQALENDYKAFRKEVDHNPLYSARLFKILSCLSGTGSTFNDSDEDILAGQREFVTTKVDFNDLYTSGFWQQAFDVWYQAASQIAQDNDILLVNDSKRMLERCGNDIPIRREVTQTIIRLFSKYGKDALLAELGTQYLTMPLNGQVAPHIVVGDTSFLPKNKLIIFYETGCGNCHYELRELKGKYKLLTDNEIQVISISADTDKTIFDETADSLPWKDKICDFNGFDGDNFKNYGIVGTPTYILTDQDGIVRGRYAQLKELLK